MKVNSKQLSYDYTKNGTNDNRRLADQAAGGQPGPDKKLQVGLRLSCVCAEGGNYRSYSGKPGAGPMQSTKTHDGVQSDRIKYYLR